MKIDQDIFRLAQAQAQVAIRQKCEDIWWLAMELLKESYQEDLCKFHTTTRTEFG